MEETNGVTELLPKRARPSKGHCLRRRGPRLRLLIRTDETRLFAAKEGDGHAIAYHEAVDGGGDEDEQREEEMDDDRLE
ncbi:hypothetical protein Ddye_025517 [Dipteronia dyeriana]|uniref:Uncharacterized protein n=1 Tax=Dipteronia dyeriana TaxID=168575 RepID=A0AAD9TL04_9ROSI|nr:hypothetical protein Ddye_025517 [Dipteronia dyeriana]